jgi:alpha-L-rhamnosidase
VLDRNWPVFEGEHLLTVSPVRFEHRDCALGLGTACPRLSWQVSTDDPDWAQTAYELELDGSATVRVDSGDQVLVPWPFDPMTSRARITARGREQA